MMFFDMWVQILSCDCGALNTAEKAILQSPFPFSQEELMQAQYSLEEVKMNR